MRAIVAEESVARSHPEKPGAVLQQAGDRRIEPVVGTELAEPVPGGGGIGRYQQHSEQQSWSAKLHLRELSARTEENFRARERKAKCLPLLGSKGYDSNRSLTVAALIGAVDTSIRAATGCPLGRERLPDGAS